MTLLPEVNCVRNVTFRRVNFTRPLKAIYVKTELDSSADDAGDDPSAAAKSGLIDGILYEQIRITVGWCRLTVSKLLLNSASGLVLKLWYRIPFAQSELPFRKSHRPTRRKFDRVAILE